MRLKWGRVARAASGAMSVLLAATACREAKRPADAQDDAAQREGAAIIEAARLELAERERQEARRPPPSAVYVPSAAASERVPFLVVLHGLGGSGAGLVSSLALRELADELGFAFIAPDGHLDYSGRRFWNASASCCNFEKFEVDHVAQLAAWIDAALKRPELDPDRVYIVGYSNGGFMAYRAACELGSRLRGIFSIAGAAVDSGARCKGAQPLGVVQIHGDADAIVAFEGGHLFADRRRPPHPSAEASVRFWAKVGGCAEAPLVAGDLDLDPRVPGAETQVLSHAGCARGAVELWRVRGGDHAAGLSQRSLRAIWEHIQRERASPPH